MFPTCSEILEVIRDLGYVRSVQRPDGKIVTVYYFWDRKTGPERYLAATIWELPKD